MTNHPQFLKPMIHQTLLIGYGNPDRQDDGVAWHILCRTAARLGRPVPPSMDVGGFYPEGPLPHLSFSLQLTPEMAETITQYDRVCFIDAHTGSVPAEVNVVTLEPVFQNSPFTHHLTPQSCLSLTRSIYDHIPGDSILVSVRGYEFGFEQTLSAKTSTLVDQAVEIIWRWMQPCLEKTIG
jgi:hydrogenase maturation protease